MTATYRALALSGVLMLMRSPVTSGWAGRGIRRCGTDAVQPYRWSNAQFDGFIDQMAKLQPTDPAFMTAYLGALEIWLRELPSLPTVKWYLRVPFNLTYWQGFPNEKNPYVCGGGWHRGASGLLLHAVTPATG